jgi:DNA-binding transcriptional regulator YhcF (GntR family)
MIVEIDARSPVPPFEQLRLQITALIEHGALADGQRLPTVRQLAADLGAAPGTVARTYKEMERRGLIESRGRHGTRVAMRGSDRATVQADESRLAEAARVFAETARSVGASEREMLQAIRNAST